MSILQKEGRWDGGNEEGSALANTMIARKRGETTDGKYQGEVRGTRLPSRHMWGVPWKGEPE